jgi:phosphatidylinositol alpha-mannosyltransferase
MRPLVQSIVDRLDGRICVSDVVREYITQYFPGNYTVIPNGIDCSRFAAQDIQPIEQYNDGRPNILFVGRLEKRKGFRHLIRAYRFVKEAIPDARLLVVGAFSDKSKSTFVRYARAAKLRGVHFIGYVPPEELPRYYRTATIFCAPSTGFESFGIILLEAMAAGLPIVASDIPGYRTVVQNGIDGLLVPKGDEQALADAVIELLRDPTRRVQMSEAGKRKAAEYDWDIVAKRLLTYYEELIAERSAEEQSQVLTRKKRMASMRKMFTWKPSSKKPRKAAT